MSGLSVGNPGCSADQWPRRAGRHRKKPGALFRFGVWCLCSWLYLVCLVPFLLLLYSCIDFSKRLPASVRRYFCKRQLGLSEMVYSRKPAFRSSVSALRKLPLSCLWPKAATISADDRGASAHANKMRRLTCAPTCASTCARTVGVTFSVTDESLVERFWKMELVFARANGLRALP